MSRTSEGWRASLCSSSLFTLDSTGHCKTVLNNDGFCQLFNARPPSPLCHYVIISSTPSFPCLLPSPNRHITKHTQWHCAFSHHHFWHSMRRHPLFSQLAPLGAISFFLFFLCVRWRRACSLIERFIMLSKGGNGAALSRSAGGGIRGSGCCRVLAAAHRQFPQCLRDISEKRSKRFKIFNITCPVWSKGKTPDGQRRTHLWVVCYWWGQY